MTTEILALQRLPPTPDVWWLPLASMWSANFGSTWPLEANKLTPSPVLPIPLIKSLPHIYTKTRIPSSKDLGGSHKTKLKLGVIKTEIDPFHSSHSSSRRCEHSSSNQTYEDPWDPLSYFPEYFHLSKQVLITHLTFKGWRASNSHINTTLIQIPNTHQSI